MGGKQILVWRLHQPFTQGFCNRFAFRMHLEFCVDVFQMKGDGVGGNTHLMRGSLVVVAVDEEFEQFGFLGREAIRSSFGRTKLAKQVHYASGYLGRHRRPAICNLL